MVFLVGRKSEGKWVNLERKEVFNENLLNNISFNKYCLFSNLV